MLEKSFSRPSAAILALLLSTSVFAQEAAPVAQAPDEHVEEEHAAEEIVVTAGRPRGSVEGNIQPEIQMTGADIRAMGASSLQEVLEQLGPQLASGGGRGGEQPVVLVNGKRIGGFREIRSIPPEAIERVDILSEEVSLTYGYPATQRVINFVLRERFNALTAEIEGGMPTAGGRGEVELEANLVRIQGDNRLVLDLGYEQKGMILESERNIRQDATGFSLAGNIVPAGNATQIDPALSALAGTTVTVAGVPASAANGAPSLNDFLATANQTSITDTGQYRSLSAATRTFTAGGSLTRPLGSMQATVSANLETNNSRALLGLPAASLLLPASNPFSPFGTDVTLQRLSATAGPMERISSDWTGKLTTAVTGQAGGWQLSFTGSYEHGESESTTDRGLELSAVSASILAGNPNLNPFGETILAGAMRQDRASSNTDYAIIDAVATGRVAELPAGAVRTTLKAGYERRDITSWSLRSGVQQETDLGRGILRGQASVDVPLTSRRNDVLGAVGDVSLNLNASADELTDFGTLFTYGYGLRWNPIDALDLTASITHEDGAPTIQQLGNPQIVTPNVRVFDFARGETVEINRLDGGNTALSADNRRILKLGATLQPKIGERTNLTLLANYTDTRITGPIAAFPTATAELEAAFPQRFLRDADGRLLQIDNRPVNFEESQRRQLRWGVNLMQRIAPSAKEKAASELLRAGFEKRRAEYEAERQKAIAEGRPPPAPPTGPGGQQQSIFGGNAGPRGPGAAPPGGQGAAPRGPAGAGPRGPGGFGNANEARIMFSLFHTWRFQDTVLIRDGLPELDLLNGSATGSSGGTSRHELEGRVMYSKQGIGGNVSLNWSSGTSVRENPGGAPSDSDLDFSGLAKVNLRLFADLGQRRSLVQSHPFFRGSRISLGVDNVFDSRRTVRDGAGVVPIAYQPDLLDPVGRRIEISFRKLFF